MNFEKKVCERLREATVSTVMTVCLSIRMEKQRSHLKDFRKISHSNVGLLIQRADTPQFYLKSDKNNVHFTRIPACVLVSRRHLFSQLKQAAFFTSYDFRLKNFFKLYADDGLFSISKSYS